MPQSRLPGTLPAPGTAVMLSTTSSRRIMMPRRLRSSGPRVSVRIVQEACAGESVVQIGRHRTGCGEVAILVDKVFEGHGADCAHEPSGGVGTTTARTNGPPLPPLAACTAPGLST